MPVGIQYGNTNYPKGMFLKIDSRLCDGGGCVALYTNAGDDAFLWMKSLHNSENRSWSQNVDQPKSQTKAASLITFREYTKQNKGKTAHYILLFTAFNFAFLIILAAFV